MEPGTAGPDGEGGPEQNFGALEHEGVPEPKDGGPWEARREEREEPLHAEHVHQRRLVLGLCDPESSLASSARIGGRLAVPELF